MPTPEATPIAATPSPRSPAQDWRGLVAIYWLTSMIESLGISQVFALLPTILREMGVAESERLTFVGLASAAIFLVGLPLVPLWGVWADKISRKAVIVRSAVVETAVFVGVALSVEPWQLAASLLLIGLQLGNTGVMLAGIRDVAPRQRLGAIMGVFGASSAIGMATGPALAGLLIDGFGWSVSGVFWLSAALTAGIVVLLMLGSREIRPEFAPEGSVLRLAFGAVRGVLADRAVRGLFLIFGLSFLANQMSRPYLPLRVEELVGTGPGLASSIALVMGTAALVGGLIGPVGGVLGDRVGFRRVLGIAMAIGGVALVLMPSMPAVAALAVLAVALAAAAATVSAMVFGLLATEVPPERRSATLNLVYLPLYGAGIVGPAIGAVAARTAGVPGPFVVGGLALLAGSVLVTRRR